MGKLCDMCLQEWVALFHQTEWTGIIKQRKDLTCANTGGVIQGAEKLGWLCRNPGLEDFQSKAEG